jgi:hypothetical protein
MRYYGKDENSDLILPGKEVAERYKPVTNPSPQEFAGAGYATLGLASDANGGDMADLPPTDYTDYKR